MSTAPRRPLLVDSSLETAFAIKYWIYAAFGFLGATFSTPSIEAVAGDTVARIISTVVFVSAGIAAVSVKRSFAHPRWMKVELYSTIALVSFVGMYCVSATILALGGDERRVSLSMIAAALVVLPIWRILQLVKGLRKENSG